MTSLTICPGCGNPQVLCSCSTKASPEITGVQEEETHICWEDDCKEAASYYCAGDCGDYICADHAVMRGDDTPYCSECDPGETRTVAVAATEYQFDCPECGRGIAIELPTRREPDEVYCRHCEITFGVDGVYHSWE